MRKLLLSALILLFSVFFTEVSNSQVNQLWKWMHPKPQGNTLRYVKAFSATNWYAIGYSGTCMWTTNAGANWILYTNAGGEQAWGAGRSLYTAWFFNTSTGLVAGSGGWIAKTTNGGINWDTLSSGSTSTLYGMHFINSTTGFVSNYNQGVLKTTNTGANWVNIPYTSTSLYSYNIFALDANRIYAPTSSTGQLMYTTNGGTNWTTVSTGASGSIYDVYFFSPDTGVVAGSSGHIRLTTNGGLNWTGINVPAVTSSYYEIKGVNSSPRQIYVVGDAFSIYKTTNFGANWTQIDHLDPAQPWTSTWYSMDIFGTTMIASGANGLFNKSTNSGANWTTSTYWLSAGTSYDVWVEYNDKKVWVVGSAGATGSGDQILYSSNGGINWVNQSILSNKYFRSIHMVNTSTGYIAGSSGAVFKTTNGGSNWDSLPFPATSLLYKTDFPNATTGWVCGTSSPYLWKTTNSGLNWASQTGPSTSVYSIDMIDANTGFHCGSSGSVKKTTDGGTTWSPVTINTTSTLYDIKMLNVNTGFVCGSSSTVRKTTNGGTTWDTVYQPYSTTLYGMDWVDITSGIVAGSSSGYTARTTDGGNDWIIENTSGSTMYNVFMRHRDSAWAVGSGYYVFKYVASPLSITTYEGKIPKEYFLSQNYPNPFNPTTTIKFGLPKAGSVTLNVYDVTGRLVRTILDNAPLNAGTVTHNFDGTNLASGVYFYTLIVDDNMINSKKMLLVK